MAWVIGIASREERDDIERAGYEVDEGVVDGVEIPDNWCGVWVDCTLIDLLDVPEHIKRLHRAGRGGG